MLWEQTKEDKCVVVNKYKSKTHFIDITRGNSVLANPSSIGFRTRDQALQDYAQYMERQLSFDSRFKREFDRIVKLLEEGETVRLGCVCKPKACHGDILRSKLLEHI